MARDTHGAVALTLALSLIPLSVAAIGAVDLTSGLAARQRLQDALDAATLAAAGSSATTETAVGDVGRGELARDFGEEGVKAISSTFKLVNNDSVVVADASTTVSTLLYQAIAGSPLTVTAHSEVTRSSANLEVSLVLDVTGSMGQPNSKIAALKSAAIDLINLVVSEKQTPFYSKVAIVPYSNSVNVDLDVPLYGNFVEYARGAGTNGCKTFGCDRYTFTSEAGPELTYDLSPFCVSERTGDHPYTDTPLSTAKVGKVYASSSRPCPAQAIQPLTSKKAVLIDKVNSLAPSGSTAGQIGLAWGWYLISPTFMGNWPVIDEQPGAYLQKRPNEVIKVVVLMTDGLFNTAYANGVISNDVYKGDNNNGGPSVHINKKADNGTPYKQAQELCKAMKAKDKKIIIYTVGFAEAATNDDAQKLMKDCATDKDHVYLPETGQQLKDAFHAIGRDIDALRISR